MKMLGLVLAVLNIFGAIAFVVVGLMDYAKREAWAYANLTQDVLVDGLPLDNAQLDPYGVPLKDKLSNDTIKAWFPTNPVSTQVDEVNRVKKLTDAQISGAGDPAKEGNPVKETVVYANILTPFAVNNDEHEYLLGIKSYLGTPEDKDKLKKRLGDAFAIALANYTARPTSLNFETAFADACRAVGGVPCPAVEQEIPKLLPAKPDKADAAKVDGALEAALQIIHDKLKAQYDGLYDEALKGPKSRTPNSNERLRDSQRDAIARLLFNMVEAVSPPAADQGASAPDYTRFVTVVGLRRGAHAIQEQAATLTRVGDELQGARERERTGFVAAHRALITDLQERAVALHDANDLLARKTQELADVEQTVRKRQDDVKNAEADLAAARKATDEQMAKLKKTSDALGQLRIQSRDALGDNLDLEKQIRGMEQKH